MFPDRSAIREQRGAGLPIALFIITVLALLVAGMAQLQQAGSESVSLQIQSQRAFFAAESGAQLAVRQVLDAGSCSAVSGSLTFPAAALTSCSAALACEASPNSVGASVFTITSTGRCGQGSPDSAERIVEVRVR
jgi:MSHA biogenesis protein MshP